MKPVVFISHIHSEAEVARWLKESISDLLLGAIDFFVSSDRSSIIGGDKWLTKIEDALKNCSVLLILCSKHSVSRPWINFEAGGAWMAGKRVVPVCHADMSPVELPEPLISLQAYALSNPQDFQDLVALLAKEADLRTPAFDAKTLVDSIPYVGIDETLEFLQISEAGELVGTGWLMPTEDPKDLTENHPKIIAFKKKLAIPAEKKLPLPLAIDLRQWCSEVKNQGKLNSSTAHAVVAMIEYFQKRNYKQSLNLSSLFLYKQARGLAHLKGDTGATLRSTLAAIRLFGIPPSEYWPYTDKKPDFDLDPPVNVYAMGSNYKGIIYFCHDPMHRNFPPSFVVANVKTFLAAGIPSVFGFKIFPSFQRSNIPGAIPLPCPGEADKWQQAVLAVGYDDTLKIRNTICNKETIGAFLIQNSWGKEWGDKGYGWITYDYVSERHALDFWSILSDAWIDSGQFGLK